MIKRVEITARIETDKVIKELFKQKQITLERMGKFGVEIMRQDLTSRAKTETGETRDSIMWAMRSKSGNVGSMARADEIINPPKSDHQVLIGSAHGAGRTTKGGNRVSIITSIEYGTRKNTNGLGFIRATADSGTLRQQFLSEYSKDSRRATEKDYV